MKFIVDIDLNYSTVQGPRQAGTCPGVISILNGSKSPGDGMYTRNPYLHTRNCCLGWLGCKPHS